MKAVFGLALVATAIAADATPRPVTRVINMLKDMKKQLEDDAKKDQEIYDKMACWCSNNDSGKTDAIAEEEAQINRLVARIKELDAKAARLGAEIEAAEKAKQASIDSLAEATTIRQNEQAEFNQNEANMLHNIDLLGQALDVLGKFGGNQNVDHTENPKKDEDAGGLDSSGNGQLNLLGITTKVRSTLKPVMGLMATKLTAYQMKEVTQFLQANAAGFRDGYNNQSGEVIGVLKQLKADTEQDLKEAQEAEMAAQSAFEKTKAAKLEEQAQLTAEIDDKNVRKADAEAESGKSQTLLDDTREALSADQKFLMELKEKCAQTDDQWAKRQKDRATEMEAVDAAIKVLNSPDAFDTFSRSLTKKSAQAGIAQEELGTFVQIKAHEQKESFVGQAAAFLKKRALQLKNPKMSLVAASLQAKAGAGEIKAEVLKPIVDKIKAIIVIQKAEFKEQQVKHGACVENVNTNKMDIQTAENKEERLQTKVDNLTSDIDVLRKAIEEQEAEVAEGLMQLKAASELRNEESLEYQKVWADQNASVNILNQAKEALAPAYGLVQGKTLLNKDKDFGEGGASTATAAPEGFSEYKKGAGGSVIALIDQIITDCTNLQTEAETAEQEKIKEYNKTVQDSAAAIKATREEIQTNRKSKAAKEIEKASAEDSLKETRQELENLMIVKSGLDKECTYLINNFNVMQVARQEEITAFENALAILNGMGGF